MNEFQKRALLIIDIQRYLTHRKIGRDDTYARQLLKETLKYLDSDKNMIFKAAVEICDSLNPREKGGEWNGKTS